MTKTRSPITTGAVWNAESVGAPGTWTHVLDDAARSAIVAVATEMRDAGVTPESATPSTAKLDALAPLTSRLTEELRHGRGFALIRNFPVDLLDETTTELAYVAFGLEFGLPVSQDGTGTLLGHVRDQRVPRTTPAIRRYATNERQDFHTDGADIIGLLCLQRARRGGESRIVSAAAVYNQILATAPDALDVLYEPMCWDRNDEQGPGEPPFFAMPVLSDATGEPRFFYIGWYIRDAQRHVDAPRLTAGQLAAMERIETIANDPAFYVEMDFQPGDIQLLNNAVILHSREAYEDDPDPARRRHLLRLWLAAHTFATVDDTLRGGIPVRDSGR
ncbi:MAG TPA: TauD/TfdA family dioxygenase [Acidimicrobiia bacterium]|nr:TauD/TfdA family dioxygenase [Acidimicrobiia bacterium]